MGYAWTVAAEIQAPFSNMFVLIPCINILLTYYYTFAKGTGLFSRTVSNLAHFLARIENPANITCLESRTETLEKGVKYVQI